MPKVELTDRFISTSKVAAGASAVDYFDSKTPGLNLRVTSQGLRTWYLVFTSPTDGKRARVTLGRYPQTGLAKARTMAIEARRQIDEGKDPRGTTVTGGAMTVADLIESFLAKHARPNLRSAKEIERRLVKNVLPLLGSIRLADLHRREINRVLDPIVERGSATESVKVFKDFRAAVRWGVKRGDLDHDPMQGMAAPAKEGKRERVLSEDEIRTVWSRLDIMTKPCHRAIIRLCLLTAQRVGEVAGIHGHELDLNAGVWTIPAARSKNKNAHSVPLSGAALAIIQEHLLGEKLFPDAGNTDVIGKAVERALPEFGVAHWTLHDLRRTAVTGMAELGVSPIVLAHVINHRSVTKAGVTLAVYSQYTYDREKREALELWADRLAGIVAGAARIVPFRA